jgi:hypothetical protein
MWPAAVPAAAGSASKYSRDEYYGPRDATSGDGTLKQAAKIPKKSEKMALKTFINRYFSSFCRLTGGFEPNLP